MSRVLIDNYTVHSPSEEYCDPPQLYNVNQLWVDWDVYDWVLSDDAVGSSERFPSLIMLHN